MACRRQLFELLEEKQEPFLLDVYLLQNGCSSVRLERLSSQGFKKRGAAVGFIKSLLTKLVHGKPFSRALSWDSKTIESGRPSVFSCFSGIGSRDLGGDHQWRCIEMDDSKQLSPVSVLEFYNHRFKEENQSSTSSSFGSPREAPEISAFPHHTKYSSKGQQLLLDVAREAEERVCDHHGNCLSSEIKSQAIHDKILSWQRLQGDASSFSLTKLLGSDMAESRNEWGKFRPEVEELGLDIESAIFDEIVDETVLEILGIHCT